MKVPAKTIKRSVIGVVGEVGVVGIILSILLLYPRVVLAQETKQFNIAQTLIVKDEEAVSGDIVSLTQESETLTRATVPYDQRMYGVLDNDPVAVYRTRATMPVARDGLALVNVTTIGGDIAVGDYVTSSEIPGKGQKAGDIIGYMIGVAIQPFGADSGEAVTIDGQNVRQGKIKVAIGIGPASPVLTKASGGLFGTIRFITNSVLYNIRSSRQFERWTRYILAALIALLVIYISYRTFGKNVTKGIEAIGRNPLAKVSIQSVIIVNVILIIIVSLGGILLSLAIISL